MPKRFYFIAGEDSGDLHTARLVEALRVHFPDMEARGVGGDRMEQAGVELSAHVRDINFMGFAEVVRHLHIIRHLFRRVQHDIRYRRPDAVVLTDYPGFNLRIAPFAQKLGVPVFYYISPQVWAWKKGRVRLIRKFVERMYAILPFEQAFYAAEGVEVDYVGHPLLDVIAPREARSSTQGPPVVALLPGSRRQEIRQVLPQMLEVARQTPDCRFVIAGAPSQSESLYHELMQDSPAELWMNRTYELLAQADYALVTSGTATLETALFGVPQAVCYKGSGLSYYIGRMLVKVPYISLVNLILGRSAVAELLQQDCTPEQMALALSALRQPAAAARFAADYAELRSLLGSQGAAQRVAADIAARMHSAGKR